MRSLMLALTLLTVAGPAVAGEVLDDYLRMLTGSWTSEAQARQDARYGVALWHIVEVPLGAAGERWAYTESWFGEAGQPYLQRLSRFTVEPDGSILARRYLLPEPARAVGAWQDPSRLASLDPATLTEVTGCEMVLTRAGAGRFEGGTVGSRCRNDHKGAAFAVSQSVLTADEMHNWDRGFGADGALVWGPADGGYRFRRLGTDASCVDPVRMLVFGEIRDRAAFGAYARALAASGLYPRFGGFYEAITPALEVFEGEPPTGRGVIIARFPCLEAARGFWHSPEYREIVKLREGIADFEVLVLPVPQRPAATR